MSIKKVSKTRYIDDEEGFEYLFQPVNDEVEITKTEEGYEARYLAYDDNPQSPDEISGDDEGLFLVNYHRDFQIERDDIISKNDVVNWYRREYEDYEDDAGKVPDHIPHADRYHIFSLSMLSHSGVMLYLGNITPGCDHGGWDTSHVGVVMVSKEEWPEEEKAREAAKGLIEEWNQYLSGDVYGIVREDYDGDKNPVDCESVWGFSGYEYAKEALKTEI